MHLALASIIPHNMTFFHGKYSVSILYNYILPFYKELFTVVETFNAMTFIVAKQRQFLKLIFTEKLTVENQIYILLKSLPSQSIWHDIE